MQIRYLKSFDVGAVTQHKLWYLPVHQSWLSCGKDLVLNRFSFDRKGLQIINSMKVHNDEITDIVEIEHPTKCIVTCSLDKKIHMYSLLRCEMIRTFP